VIAYSYRITEQDPDPHQSDNEDPDLYPHQSERGFGSTSKWKVEFRFGLDGIRIRIKMKRWIRIRIQMMGIRNTGYLNCASA
jgi:hypothetical protein